MTQETEHLEVEEAEQDDEIIGHAFKWSLLVIFGVLIIGAIIFIASRQPEAIAETIERDAIAAPDELVQTTDSRPEIVFRDVTRSAGIDFTHVSGARGEKLLPETMGGGCAFLDFDNDGDQDLLFPNGHTWPHDGGSGSDERTVLYENDGKGSFTRVADAAGLGIKAYAMGAAVGDVDNDGWVDVFLTCLGPNRLFMNREGRFEEVRNGPIGGADTWSASAGFFDMDNDGDLDLFVTNYIQWSREVDIALAFSLNGTDRAYGPPLNYQGTYNYLYRNDGDGSFTDISEQAGLHVNNPATGEPLGKGLAITIADFDDDGLLDVFVANDTVQNFMFRNKGGGRFEEIGMAAGVAFDTAGKATGAMGMDAARFEGDDAWCVAIGNFSNESSSLYMQQPGSDPWFFADVSAAEGIGSPSRLKLSFGLFFFDADLDGRLDMLQANGHLEDEITEVQPSQHYRQSAQLFWNRGGGDAARFAEVPEDETGDLSTPIVGRGAAYADIDGDGDLDLVLCQPGGPPLLLANQGVQGHHWLRVRLVGKDANRDGIGATLHLTVGDRVLHRQVMPTRSYLSQVELPVSFGLGEAREAGPLRITWPGGKSQTVQVSEVDTLLVVEEAP